MVAVTRMVVPVARVSAEAPAVLAPIRSLRSTAAIITRRPTPMVLGWVPADGEIAALLSLPNLLTRYAMPLRRMRLTIARRQAVTSSSTVVTSGPKAATTEPVWGERVPALPPSKTVPSASPEEPSRPGEAKEALAAWMGTSLSRVARCGRFRVRSEASAIPLGVTMRTRNLGTTPTTPTTPTRFS